MNISIINSAYLLFLFLIPVFVLIHFISIRTTRAKALRFANFDALARIRGIDLYSKNLVILILSILIVVSMSFAMAGTIVTFNRPMSKFSFVIAIDASQSMSADDFTPNRLSAAKSTALSFVDSTPLGTKIGVVSFAGNSYIESALTDSKGTVKDSINGINITSVGGTDIYEAVITGTNLLSQESAKSIILLSDGQINVGNVDDAIAYANKFNVVVNTIAIGTKVGGNATYGLSQVDEDSLKALAFNTGGNFSNVQSKDDLQKAFNSMLNIRVAPGPLDISRYLMILAVVLFVLMYVLANTRYRAFP